MHPSCKVSDVTAEVQAWCNNWGLKVPRSMSAAVLFANKGKYEQISLRLHDDIFSIKIEYWYLGVIFKAVSPTTLISNRLRPNIWSGWTLCECSWEQTGLWEKIRFWTYTIQLSSMEWRLIFFLLSLLSIKIQFEVLRICTGATRTTLSICLHTLAEKCHNTSDISYSVLNTKPTH